MSNFTYRQLICHLSTLDENQQQMNVTIYDKGKDEYFPVNDIFYADDNDVLDANHPYLIMK